MKKAISLTLLLSLTSCVTNKQLMRQLKSTHEQVALARVEIKVVRDGQVRVDSLYRLIFKTTVDATTKANDKAFENINDADLMRLIRETLGPVGKPKQ